jgi:hypothetical protein
MTKRIALDRLREISGQRSIRRAQLLPIRSENSDQTDDAEPGRVEWPIRSSLSL